jgi:hypothetical protein
MTFKSALRFQPTLWAIALLTATLCTAAPSASAETGFVCRNASGGSSGFIGHITDVRVGQHPGFDRFVIQFRGVRVPVFHATRQSDSRFTTEGKGRVVTLRGHAGIDVALPRATGAGSYHGRLDFKPPFAQVREARETGDFEAVTHWGLGIHQQSCMRVFTLQSPGRLVVDVPH